VHDDAVAAVAEHERRMQAAAEARAKAVQAAEEPFRAPTQALNEALGFEVFRSHTQGIERTGSFQSVPTQALVMMLQGRVATGTFSGDYQAILDLLTSTAVREG
jgi:CO/xanthine dehydrogenase Mo-binding subunit